MSARLHRLTLALILTVYLILAVGYGVVTPLFETPDEHLHYFTADFIAREGRLPVIGDPGLMGQEAAQPPLYYALASLLIRVAPDFDAGQQLWPNPRTDTSAVAGQLWHNPQADPEDPRGESRADPPINVNMFVHGPAEAWPWRGYAAAGHLVRLLSALFGLGTLLCIHGAGRTVWPADPARALLATALVAFLPQFAFLHGAVTNDAAITFFSAAAIWQLLRVTSDERRVTSDERRTMNDERRTTNGGPGNAAYLLLGLTIGLAMLSKAAGLLLLVYCVAVLAVQAWSRGGARRATRATETAALVALPALVLGGWLLWRNWTLYGDPTAANQFVLMAGGERPYSLYQVWLDMDRVWASFFALFGWMNLQPPAWVWLVWSAIAAVAFVGALWGVVASARRRSTAPAALLFHPAVLLFGWFALVALAWLQFMLQTPADQGRLFYPALIPLALGAAYGLSRWPRPWTGVVAVGLALLTSLYCLVAVIPNAYAPSPVVAAVPAEALPLDVPFAEGADLLGARVDTPIVRVGDWVWLTLYWRGRPEMPPGAPLAHLELFGRGFHRIGLLTGYHGRGNYPATLWPPGEIVADRMAVRVLTETVAPVEARLTIKLDEDAQGIDVGRVKIVPAEWPEPGAAIATLGGVELAAAELSTATDAATAAPGETVTLRLRWQVAEPPGPGLLHVFAHLGDPTQPPLAQADGPAMGGEYPSHLWAAGEVFEETVSLTLPADLPPGDYPIHVGLYDFDSGARLPVTVDGQRLPTDAFPVGNLQIR